MMKQKALLTLMICSSSWLVGCDTTQTTHPFRANAFMTASAKQTNANIISDLIAVNKNVHLFVKNFLVFFQNERKLQET